VRKRFATNAGGSLVVRAQGNGMRAQAMHKVGWPPQYNHLLQRFVAQRAAATWRRRTQTNDGSPAIACPDKQDSRSTTSLLG